MCTIVNVLVNKEKQRILVLASSHKERSIGPIGTHNDEFFNCEERDKNELYNQLKFN